MLRTPIAAGILLLAGCQTLDFGAGVKPTIALISTVPPGALVTVEGFGECQSPCTVELDAPRNVTIAKAGYNPHRFVLTPGKKKVEITLELSAPTTDVDAETLPDVPGAS
jgi:hypothetical protein